MRKQKYYVYLEREETGIVVQSLNRCAMPCSGKTGIPIVWTRCLSK